MAAFDTFSCHLKRGKCVKLAGDYFILGHECTNKPVDKLLKTENKDGTTQCQICH